MTQETAVDEERWSLVDALFWIATRSLEYMRSNPATHFDWLESALSEMRGAWRYMPSGPSARQAQEMLWEKLTNGEIAGRATCTLRTYVQTRHYGNVTNHFDHEEVLEDIDFPPTDNRGLVARLEFAQKSFVLRVHPSPHPLQEIFFAISPSLAPISYAFGPSILRPERTSSPRRRPGVTPMGLASLRCRYCRMKNASRSKAS